MIKEILSIFGIIIILVCLIILFKPKKKRDEYLIFKNKDCDNTSCGSCWSGQNRRTLEKTACFRTRDQLERYIDGK